MVLVMLRAADVLGDPGARYMAAARAAADDIWQRGLLRKVCVLCVCGGGGSPGEVAAQGGGLLTCWVTLVGDPRQQHDQQQMIYGSGDCCAR
jgi:hypothetical protein